MSNHRRHGRQHHYILGLGAARSFIRQHTLLRKIDDCPFPFCVLCPYTIFCITRYLKTSCRSKQPLLFFAPGEIFFHRLYAIGTNLCQSSAAPEPVLVSCGSMLLHHIHFATGEWAWVRDYPSKLQFWRTSPPSHSHSTHYVRSLLGPPMIICINLSVSLPWLIVFHVLLSLSQLHLDYHLLHCPRPSRVTRCAGRTQRPG